MNPPESAGYGVAMSDDLFDKAASVNSDAQLYKQAGNGVTVNVVYSIGRKIADMT